MKKAFLIYPCHQKVGKNFYCFLLWPVSSKRDIEREGKASNQTMNIADGASCPFSAVLANACLKLRALHPFT